MGVDEEDVRRRVGARVARRRGRKVPVGHWQDRLGEGRTAVGATETAVPHREPGWNLVIPAVWTEPSASPVNIRWARDTFAASRPHLASRRWLSYLGDDQGDDAIRAAYGPNHERLRAVKRRYDPGNVFHLNHNIRPA